MEFIFNHLLYPNSSICLLLTDFLIGIGTFLPFLEMKDRSIHQYQVPTLPRLGKLIWTGLDRQKVW